MFTDKRASQQLRSGTLRGHLHETGREVTAQFPGCSKILCIYREHWTDLGYSL